MVLDEIVKHKWKEIERAKRSVPLAELKNKVRRLAKITHPHAFRNALTAPNPIHLICELKKASPSSGLLKSAFDPERIANEFESAGASALSVLTEERYFGGGDAVLERVRHAVKIPILRKDFILDPYQIYETKALGADAFLLIAAILNKTKIRRMIALGRLLGIDCLVEVHSSDELEMALECGANIIGINNRNLKTLKVNRFHAESILPQVPKKIVAVVESGIQNRSDIVRYRKLGVRCFLIGTSLMRAKNIHSKMKELLGTKTRKKSHAQG